MSGTDLVSETLMIRNMVSNCCVVLLRERLEAAGIIVNQVQLGQVFVFYDPVHHNHNTVAELIREIGLDVIEGREMIMVEKTKQAVIELIHHMNNVDSVVRKSDYLVEKLGYSYQYLSKTFSAHEPVTLERYIILQKIERIKQLIDNNEFTLSETGFVFDPTSGESYSINSTGQEIIALLKEDKSPEEISTIMTGEYEIDTASFEKYYYDFMGMLRQFQLIEEDE